MENLSSTLKPRTRKRKTYTHPRLPDRILTRSRTSSFAQSNPISRRSMELLPGSNCESISRIYCVKDLRARRIFTPDVNSIPKCGEELKGESKGLDPKPDLDPVELGGGEMEMSGAVTDSDVKVDPSQVLSPDLGSVEPETDLNQIPPITNRPISTNKMAVNTCKRRKIFTSPSSYSLKRMLPFLMDIANESGDTKFEIQGVESSYRIPKCGVNSENEVKPKNKVAYENIGDVGNGVDLEIENMTQIEVKSVSSRNGVRRADSSVEEECGQMTPPHPPVLSKMDVDCKEQTLTKTQCGQMTPPDPSVLSKMDVDCKQKTLKKTQARREFSLGGEKRNNGCVRESRGHANLMVLNPCSRLRVFKTENSVSFRRLLPFLMNMSKDDPSASAINQQPSPQFNSEEGSDPLLVSTAELSKHPTEDQDRSSFEGDCITSSPNPLQSANSPSNSDPSPLTSEINSDSSNTGNLLKQGSDESRSGSPESPRNGITSSDLQERNLVLLPSPPVKNHLSEELTCEEHEYEDILKKRFDVVEVPNKNGESAELDFNRTSMKVVVSDTAVSPISGTPEGILKCSPGGCTGSDESMSGSSESPCNYIKGSEMKVHNLALPPSPVENCLPKQSRSEKHELAANQTECLDVVHKKNGESVKKLGLNKSSMKAVVSEMMDSPSNGVLKGILKRNPRGCRGLCNCLKCASFRLNAERAFEFSCNQMHDSEEVASDLISELTALRLMLENSVVQEDGLAVIQLSSVREACRKALEAENLAKARLHQMNDDVNLHSRIPVLLPPQVKFSSSVKEADYQKQV